MGKSLESEIDAMLKDLDANAHNENSDEEEEVVDEKDTEDDTKTSDAGGDVDSDEEVEDDGEESGEKDEEDTEGENEGDDKEDEESDWRTEMNALAEESLGKKEKKEEEDGKALEEDVGKQKVDEKEKLQYRSGIDISEEDYEEAMATREGFNKVIKKIDDTFALRTQQLIRALPGAIKGIAGEAISARLAISDFFQMNKDLVPYKALVEVMYNKIADKHPDKDASDVLDLTGKEVRKRLKLDKASDGSHKSKKESRTPGTVDKKGGGTRKPQQPKLTGMEAEISEMLKYSQQ